VRGSGPEVTI